jgi:Ca2+-binding EF-hand superfamily protein
MIRIQLTVVLGALAALVGGVALAAEPEKLRFETLDTNHDGRLSPAEAAASEVLSAAFKTLDRNNDGIVNRREFAEFQQGTPTPTP